ncbi:MAG: hypothetical protein ABI605_12620 [Rhizobacter sp.]
MNYRLFDNVQTMTSRSRIVRMSGTDRLGSTTGRCSSGNQLRVRPLLPAAWSTFDVSYRFGASTFHITCRKAAEGVVADVVLDGVATAGDTLTLIEDGRDHVVVVNAECLD